MWKARDPTLVGKWDVGGGNREILTFLPSDWGTRIGEAGFIYFNRVAATGLLKTKPGWMFTVWPAL